MASVAPRRSNNAPRRGSAFVSPVVSSSENDSSEDKRQQEPQARRPSRWSRDSSSSSSSESSEESSSFSVDEGNVHDLETLTDAYEDFVGRRTSQRSQASSQSSVAKLDRLRRIFLNMPAKTREKKTEKTEKKQREKQPQAENPQRAKKSKSRGSSSIAGTSSNSSGDERPGETSRVGTTTVPPLTLPIDHHVKTLSEQVKRLARTHDAHAHQWHVMLTQAIAELQFVKQQEEHALQSHVQLLQESYALRLEVFEQQYRAKVTEIRDQMQQEIARHRQQSDSVIVTTAKRLQEQAQQVLLQTDGRSNQDDVAVVTSGGVAASEDANMTLVKTNQFLQRQQQREDARRSRQQPAAKAETEPVAAQAVLSPVSKQRAKLKLLEQKLAQFPRDTVNRVTRTMENQVRERRSRGDPSAPSTIAAVLATARNPEPCGSDGTLPPTPLSPLRKRASYWHNGISRESQDQTDPCQRSQVRPSTALSRRFLRPEEEQELRMLRNSIGLAKDWMEQHHSPHS